MHFEEYIYHRDDKYFSLIKSIYNTFSVESLKSLKKMKIFYMYNLYTLERSCL